MALPTFYFLGVVLTTFLGVVFISALCSSRIRHGVSRHLVFYLSLIAFILYFWFASWGSTLGFFKAKMDLRRGIFHIYSIPFQAENRRLRGRATFKTRIAFSRILKERYGVWCPPIRGCFIFSSKDLLFERAYDLEMLPAIEKHFRHDIMEECMQAALYETME